MAVSNGINFLLFGLFLLFGIVFSFCLQFKNFLIEKIKKNKLKIVVDIFLIVIFCLTFYGLMFLTVLNLNFGNFRAYMFFSFAFGIYFNKKIFSKLIALIFSKVYNLFKGKLKCKKELKKQ